jgi:hypothetical protein
MGDENRSYYRARAEQELTAASQAINSEAEAVHRALAQRYQNLAVETAQHASPLSQQAVGSSVSIPAE